MAALDRVRGRLKDPEAPAADPTIGAQLAKLSAFLEDPMLARMLTIQVRTARRKTWDALKDGEFVCRGSVLRSGQVSAQSLIRLGFLATSPMLWCLIVRLVLNWSGLVPCVFVFHVLVCISFYKEEMAVWWKVA